MQRIHCNCWLKDYFGDFGPFSLEDNIMFIENIADFLQFHQLGLYGFPPIPGEARSVLIINLVACADNFHALLHFHTEITE
jgi:hypothetical protein